MTLIRYPKCGKIISSEAASCPECGLSVDGKVTVSTQNTEGLFINARDNKTSNSIMTLGVVGAFLTIFGIREISKMKKRIITIIFLLVFPLMVEAEKDNSLISVSYEPIYFEPTDISIDQIYTVPKFSVVTITPILTPINATTVLSCESLNPQIAKTKVSGTGYSINLIGVSVGETTITIYTENGLSVSALVVVTDIIEPNNILLDNEYQIEVNERKFIDFSLIPQDAVTLLRIESGDNSIVSTFTGGTSLHHDDGFMYAPSIGILGVKEGTTTVTVTTINGLSFSANVLVSSSVEPSSIIIPEEHEIIEGTDWDVPITISPENAKTSFTIRSADTSIVRVATTGSFSGCRVFGFSAGKTEIYIYTHNDLSASCLVTVVHDWEEEKTIDKEPSCADGSKSVHCRVCEEKKDIEIIPGSGLHSLTKYKQINPTCTEEGVEAYWRCEVCGEFFSDAEAENKIDAPVTIAAKGHTLTAHAKVDATCTETGTEAYWSCNVCEKLFSDSEGKNEIDAPIVIAAKDHKWNTAEYKWAEDNSTLTATRTCVNDESHIDTETVTVTATIISPTDNNGGSVTYTSAEFSKDGFTVQVKNLEIPALKDMSVINLPSMLITIEYEAFENLACEAIIIPNSCTSIGNYAFRNCKNLKYIKVPANVEIPSNAFEGCENVVIDRTVE